MPNTVITGAAHGIGAALARRCARAGHAVAVLDLDGEAAAKCAAKISGAGVSSLGLRCDVTSEGDCRGAMESLAKDWGGIDLLVNNAGITHVGRIDETESTVLRRVMEVNFFGAVQMTKAALPWLLAREGGAHVVALSSVAGFAPLATRAGYAASKHALEGFFSTLRAEHVADGLRVSLVRPSFVSTGIGRRALAADGGPAADGARSGVAHELRPESAADIIFAGICKGRRTIWVGREARLSWWVSHLWPGLYERSMIRRTLG